MLAFFGAVHKEATGLRYMAAFARDTKILRDVVYIHGLPYSKYLISIYFKMDDNGFGYSVPGFLASMPRCIAARKRFVEYKEEDWRDVGHGDSG